MLIKALIVIDVHGIMKGAVMNAMEDEAKDFIILFNYSGRVNIVAINRMKGSRLESYACNSGSSDLHKQCHYRP